MKKKTKAWILVLMCIALIGSLDDNKIVSLNEVIPFEWDFLYTFEPYQSKAEIAEIIAHLLFVKNDKVVASILSYGSNLE